MAYKVTLALPGSPDPEILRDAANVQARANADWFVRQWEQGFALPHCCADLRYRPRPSSSHVAFASPAEVYRRGYADCWEAATILCGLFQADARIARGATPEGAAQMFTVDFEPGQDPAGRSEDYWHAVVRHPHGVQDPTERMI